MHYQRRSWELSFCCSLIPSLNANHIGSSYSSGSSQGIQVINAVWGTTASPAAVAPGDHGVSLTITAQYYFSGTATGVQALLTMPQGFTLFNGSNVDFASVSGTIPSSTVIQFTFQGIYLSSNVSLGTFTFPLNFSWTASGYAYTLTQESSIKMSVLGRPALYTALNQTELIPAQVNSVPLMISNNGSGSASNIIITASSQQGAILNTISKVSNISAGAYVSEPLQIYIPQSVAGNIVYITITMSYQDPYGNNKTTSEVVTSYASQAAQPKLQYETTQQTLTPGVTNTVNLTLLNTGNIPLEQISSSFSTQSQYESVTGSFPYVQSLIPGQSINSTIGIYVAPSASNSAFSLTVTSNFIESNGISGSSTQTLGFSTSNYVSPVSIQVKSLVANLSVGQSSRVSFEIQNLGQLPVNSPTIGLGASTPLVVSGNSSFSSPGYVIPPGGSMIFNASLSSSPSAAPGSYSGQLSVSVVEPNGNSYQNSFTVGFTLYGTIDFVVQGETVTQSGSNYTITGTLLNEGTAIAYYTYIVAGLGASSPSSPSAYIGEVDPNTPLPFSVTTDAASSQSVSSAQIVLQISYKDNFGTNRTAILSTVAPVSVSETSTATSAAPHSRGLGLVTILAAIIIVLLALLGVAALRRRGSPSSSEKNRKSKVV
jgi:hypothetical protein